MATDVETLDGAAPAAPPGPVPSSTVPSGGGEDGGWRKDRQNRFYTAARGRSGVVYRQGNETIEEALVRDSKGPKDRPPRKAKAAKKPPAPTTQGLKELEHALAEGLRAPAYIGAATGDEWVTKHFAEQAPILARNLVAAAEHNPWLREKLEAAMADELILMKVITTMGVAGALIGYALPPLVYYFNPPFVPAKARELYGIPDRPKEAEDAHPAPAPAPAEPPAAAAA